MSAIAPTPPVESAAAPPPGHFRRALTRFGFSAASLSLSQIVKRSFRLVVLFLTARILGPSLFGQYVLLLTALELIAVLSGSGYVDLLARDIARDHGVARSLMLRLTSLRLMFTASGSGILLLILWRLRYPPSVIRMAGLLLVTLIPRSVNESCQGVLRGTGQFEKMVWIEIFQGLALAGTALVLLLRHAGLPAIIYAEILGALAGAVVAFGAAADCLRGSDSAIKATTLRSAWAFNLYPLIVNVYDRADIFILSKIAGDFAVGIYGIPYRIYATLQILPYGIMGVLLPDFSRADWGKEGDVRCQKVIQFLYTAALLLIIAVWFIVPFFLRLFLGPRFQRSEIALRILVWATIPMFLNFGMNTVILGSGRERHFIRTASVCTFLNLAGNLLLVPRFSFVAAAIVTVCTEVALLAQNIFLVRRITGAMPLPGSMFLTSATFAGIAAIAVALQHLVPQAVVGGLATCAFAAVCYSSEKARYSYAS